MDGAAERRHQSPGWRYLCRRLMGKDEQPYLFSTNTGNGFITRPSEPHSRTRTGKSVLTVAKGVRPMIPCPIYDIETDWIC